MSGHKAVTECHYRSLQVTKWSQSGHKVVTKWCCGNNLVTANRQEKSTARVLIGELFWASGCLSVFAPFLLLFFVVA